MNILFARKPMPLQPVLWAALLSIASASAQAGDIIPYPTRGVENTKVVKFVATQTGPISAYFLGGNSSYELKVRAFANGAWLGNAGLSNRTSKYGTKLDFPYPVTVGDSVFIELGIQRSDPATFNGTGLYPYWAVWSGREGNSDRTNHSYVTAFSGDRSASIPAGVYIGFEDEPRGGDFDYKDAEYVFTNLTPVPVAAPAAPAAATPAK